MRLFFTPTDVLFFRSALAFTAGEDAAAQSLFPPTPETMQGMLRALIASHWAPTVAEAFDLPEVRELVGDRTSYGRFRLTSFTLGRRRDGQVERLFPAPAHLQRALPREVPILLRPDGASEEKVPSPVTNLPDGMRILVPPDDLIAPGMALEPFGAWLTEVELAACLRGEPQGVIGTQASAIYTMEPRVGIGLRPARKTVEEGLFYQQAVVRMTSDYGFVVDVEIAAAAQPTEAKLSPERKVAAADLLDLLRLPRMGWSQLGGERRVLRYEVLADPPIADPRPNFLPGQHPLLYFASPTCFNGGWRPERWETTFGATPVAAAIPRIQLIGGWSLAGGAPKLLRRCVPAGSVYFFDRPLAVPGPYADYGREIGYGHAMEGAW